MLTTLRIIGGWAILAAVIALVDDVTRAYETGSRVAFASLGKEWDTISPSTLASLKASIVKHAAPVLWDPLLVTVLKAPAFATFAVLGVLLFAAGLRRRGLNVFAN